MCVCSFFFLFSSLDGDENGCTIKHPRKKIEWQHEIYDTRIEINDIQADLFYKPKISVSFVRHFFYSPASLQRWSIQFGRCGIFFSSVCRKFKCPRRFEGIFLCLVLSLSTQLLVTISLWHTIDACSFNSHSNAAWNTRNTNHRTNFIDSITCFILKIPAPPMEFLCFSFFSSSCWIVDVKCHIFFTKRWK